MKISARRLWLMGVLIVVLAAGACMPGLALEGIPGRFSVQLGFSYAQEVNEITGDTGGSQTTMAWGVDYRYPLGSRFGIGASLLNWKFDSTSMGEGSHGDTSLCFNASYLMGKTSNQELFLGIGSDLVRFGFKLYPGESDIADRGLFYSVEIDAPYQDDVVGSFSGFALGYSF